ncbi:cytochrome c oxidase subunit II [Lignipirellula cremea]|uniref:Cytochrome c oxidase subunit 2 n=1 Tax=Lignipirellula cremea TaxID=2528010 RepID=A0A518DYU0_9BACT|nr:cytochrome c oxidase subunit II [Lignipirellula cremea]QDU97010.1 Cytochrome c oxidase subunit 2 precursor [Lignipirellula cremea]
MSGTRWWTIPFLLVPILGVAVFVMAIADIWPFERHWLPLNINENGRVIDSLFMFILVLTGIIFIGTSMALFWVLWRYDAARNADPVQFTHGSHTLEVVWSILPAAVLLFIAIYQMNAWADAKLRRPTEMLNGEEAPQRPLALVTGRQFEWRITYAGADGEIGTEDDLFTVNDLHVPLDEEVVLQIESEDVLHSFFLPNMRTKQDVVPGMRQFTWFKANRSGVYDIVCAELCGWGHYKMRGRLTVEPREKFDIWMADALQEQNRSSFVKPEEE